MKPVSVRALISIFTLGITFASNASEFRPLFDGKSLEGWKSPNMSYWSVQDGTITAECTDTNPAKKNQFLVWQHGEIDDFVLRLKFRIEGPPNANSGIQIRSEIDDS